MKQILVILVSLFILTSCGKGDSWSPEDDIKDFQAKNPYCVVFENKTDGDLYLKCTGLASTTFPMLKQGTVSDTYCGPKADITVEYSGEGTHFSKIKKQIRLSKEQVSRVALTYP